jgi:hypothetical protein
LKKEEAIQLLLDGKVDSVGVKRAVYADIPTMDPIEMVWFDLIDQDHNARLEDGKLYLDVWYSTLRFPNPPKEAIIDTKQVRTPDGMVTLNKFRMIVGIEYINLDGKRIWLDEE